MQAAIGQLCSGAGSEPAQSQIQVPPLLDAWPWPAPGVSAESDPLGLGSATGSQCGLYSLFQEIVQKGHAVTEETFSYLLMGCIQDKKTGFRYTLQVCPFQLCLSASPAAPSHVHLCQVQMMTTCPFEHL